MKVLYIDMDNVLVDFPSGIDHISATDRASYKGRLDEVPGIFGLMTPLEEEINVYLFVIVGPALLIASVGLNIYLIIRGRKQAYPSICDQ